MPSSDLGHRGVIGVVDNHRRRVEPGHRLPPAPHQVLKLAVAVELVAEQVHQRNNPGPGLVDQRWQRGLVHLEQGHLGPISVEQRGSHPPLQVRSRGVGHHPSARGVQHGPHQPSGGGLAVGARQQDHAPRDGASHLRSSLRPQPGQHQPRQRRPPAPPQPLRQPPRPPSHPRSQPPRHRRHPHQDSRCKNSLNIGTVKAITSWEGEKHNPRLMSESRMGETC